MAKKKVNQRRDYDLGSRDVITYKKSPIPRQMQFMVLRGTGLNVQQAIEENAELKKMALRKHFKLKFMQANSVDEFVMHLKDANTWATGVVYNLGDLIDESKTIQKTIDRILITTFEVQIDGKNDSVIAGIESLSKA